MRRLIGIPAGELIDSDFAPALDKVTELAENDSLSAGSENEIVEIQKTVAELHGKIDGWKRLAVFGPNRQVRQLGRVAQKCNLALKKLLSVDSIQ